MRTLAKDILNVIQNHLPRKMAHTLIHFRFHKKLMNWRCPKTYDEKIRWILVNCYGKNVSRYADKYLVRDYVKECNLEKILIPIYGIWNNTKDINISILPQQFILKTTNGSGSPCYAIVKNRNDTVEVKNAIERIEKGLLVNLAKETGQYHYAYIKPKIICEKLLSDGGVRMTDYKILCFDGVAKFILVCNSRDEGRDYFDINWNHLKFSKKEFQSKKNISCPPGFKYMLEAAELLSKPFAFARIDFYDVDGAVYFGEITLTPSAGFTDNLTEEAQLQIGKMINLPKKESIMQLR